MLGTNDLDRAARFYDSLLGSLGAERYIVTDRGISWTFGTGTTSLCVTKPFDGVPASIGNGVMVALVVDSTEKVDQVYNKAIELGAQDEGPAGPREGGFYAGYFRDLDGNKLNVFHFAGG